MKERELTDKLVDAINASYDIASSNTFRGDKFYHAVAKMSVHHPSIALGIVTKHAVLVVIQLKEIGLI